ncbi:MAG TPA: TM2 domain-containing protein [Devosia sp.]
MAFCHSCGTEINSNQAVCLKCGVAVNSNSPTGQIGPVSEKEWLPALLLAFFVGVFGVHRFYTGHIGIGIAQLLTLGGCGIWSLIDFIMIITGSYKDVNGLPLKKT